LASPGQRERGSRLRPPLEGDRHKVARRMVGQQRAHPLVHRRSRRIRAATDLAGQVREGSLQASEVRGAHLGVQPRFAGAPHHERAERQWGPIRHRVRHLQRALHPVVVLF